MVFPPNNKISLEKLYLFLSNFHLFTIHLTLLPLHGILSSSSSFLCEEADVASLTVSLVDVVVDDEDFHLHISLKHLNLNSFNDVFIFFAFLV